MRWQKVRGLDSYSVSDGGDVRNDVTGELKTPTINKRNGYFYVDLYKDNKRMKRPIHRLVAEAFIPNPDGKKTVDHIDGCRTNNVASNLRWATYSENNSRFETVGTRSEPVTVFHYKEQRDKRTGGHEKWLGVDSVMNFRSIKECAEHFGVTLANISLMLEKGEVGRRGKMRGYRFEYQNGGRSRHGNV